MVSQIIEDASVKRKVIAGYQVRKRGLQCICGRVRMGERAGYIAGGKWTTLQINGAGCA